MFGTWEVVSSTLWKFIVVKDTPCARLNPLRLNQPKAGNVIKARALVHLEPQARGHKGAPL